MSNSFKKFPRFGMCGDDHMGRWKRESNRNMRRSNKILLHVGKELRIMREVADIYDSPADGWQFINKERKELQLIRPKNTIKYKYINEWLRK